MPEELVDSKIGRAKRIWAVVLYVMAVIMLLGMASNPDLEDALTGVAFGVGGWLLWRSAAKARAAAERMALGRLQMQVLALAREDGRLTVTEVASRLNWTMDRAGTVLASLDDGLRVCSVPSDAGVIVYEFRELIYDPDRPQLEASAPPPLPRAQPGR